MGGSPQARSRLLGESSAILDVTRQTVRFSKLSNLPVMITGESGRARHCEREIVDAAMQQVDYKQPQAARLLGLTPRSIYNKLRKYHLSRGEIPLS